MSKLRFLVKKIVIFFIIYIVSAIIAEGIIILGFSIAGYSLLNGNIPQGVFFERALPLLGFAVFIGSTILYVKLIEKKSIKSIGLLLDFKSLAGFLKGFLISMVLLFLIFTFLSVVRIYEFEGFAAFDPKYFIIFLIAFTIQSTAEELMCRGFLMNRLEERYSKKVAALISSIVFVLPHLASIEMGLTGVISIINLLLVSFFCSTLFYRYGTISVCSGFHSGWNFVVSFLCGLTLSGMDAEVGFIKLNIISSNSILTGGSYGIEASAILTVVLIKMNIMFTRKRSKAHGVS